jgi:hypothetical protein
MTKREGINKLKELVQIAGPDRLRALFGKYNLKANLNVSGVITGVELYGRPFFADFAKIVTDAQRAKVRATDTDLGLGIPAGPTSSADDAPASGGFNWDSMLGWLNTFANTGASIYNSTWGNNGDSTTVVQPGTNTPYLVVQPNGDSGSSNTALWVIGGVVAVILVVVVIFLAMKK